MAIIKDNEIDLITVIKTNDDEFKIAFLEWNFPENTETDVKWSMTRNTNNDTNYILESKPFIKTYKLEKSFSEYNNDIISNIKNLCSINKDSDLICEQELSINIKYPEQIIRKLISKIRQTCEIIRQESRISQGDKIITNKKLGEILILNKEFAPDVLSYVFIDENQEDDIIYIYRKNTTHQPGLVLVYNDKIEKYSIETIGNNYNKSYRSFNIITK